MSHLFTNQESSQALPRPLTTSASTAQSADAQPITPTTEDRIPRIDILKSHGNVNK